MLVADNATQNLKDGPGRLKFLVWLIVDGFIMEQVLAVDCGWDSGYLGRRVQYIALLPIETGRKQGWTLIMKLRVRY